jgi:hypothetical protein
VQYAHVEALRFLAACVTVGAILGAAWAALKGA